MRGTYLETFLGSRFPSVDNSNLQSFQVTGKHSPLDIIQSRQIFRTRFSENPGGEGNKVATLVHRTDGGIAIEIEFSYLLAGNQRVCADPRTNRLIESFPETLD
jgi:hypothetical protein